MTSKSSIQKSVFESLSLKDIYPKGWFKKQLVVQKEGLTGHIEEIWEDLGPNSGWLGGEGESWQQGPYYLDGFIPLAYLLRDESLMRKAQKWIEWMLESQTDEGFFGPFNNNDWWPRMVALKAIMQYHQATEDERVLPFMDQYFCYHYENIQDHPFEMWSAPRGFEELLPIIYLYKITGKSYLLELAQEILKQSYNWGAIFNNFPYKETTHKYLNRELFLIVKRINISLENINKKRKPRLAKYRNKRKVEKKSNSKNMHRFHETHSVNIAMAFKMPVLEYLLDGNPESLETARNGISQVMKYHGMTNHVFSGDEHLNGHSPNVGAELCLVAEYMHSLETMLEITGVSEYADMLEQVAYNAWPATFLQDMTAHQYVQQVNQIEVSKKKRGWYDGYNESNIFGLEPNYGCCTANMHQGWPKLAGSILLKHKDGLTTGIYAPCSVQLQIDNTDICVTEVTDYPFNGVVELHIDKVDNARQALRFPLWLRIPSWCNEFTVYVNGKGIDCSVVNGYVKIHRDFSAGDRIRLKMMLALRVLDTGRGSVSLHYGALLMALPIEGQRRKLRGEEPFADWEMFPMSEWRYAVVKSQVADAKIFQGEPGKYPFGDANCAVEATLNMAPALQWKRTKGDSGKIPELIKVSEEEVINKRLVPFGCTRLRIAEFPVAETKGKNTAGAKI